MKKNTLSEKIRGLADAIGVDAFGFSDASEFTGYALHHSRRRDPKLSLPNAKTIIVAGIYIGGLTLPDWESPWYGRTSRLYLSGFFVDVVKPLEPIVSLLKDEGYSAVVCESSEGESSILPLKLAAIRAGIGWQGRHSLLISPKYGTFLALGGIVTDAPLEPNDTEAPDRCGDCNRCREACPLAALDQPNVLNVERCLSYLLQVEDLPEDARRVSSNRVGDCEICQQVCPWNRKHLDNPLQTKMTKIFLEKVEDWKKIFYLPNLVKMTEEEYGKVLGHLNTGVSYPIFRRNVSLAMERAKTSRG
jgi:epoxyqueuosine reductase QueG